MSKVIAIVGPTASGKTSLSIALAKKYGGEIISADSMQFYRCMNIGTAKPDMAERDGIPHRMIDILDITESFSVSDFCERCDREVQEVQNLGKLPIMCGGTGFYVDSFLDGIKFGQFENDPELRDRLYKELDEVGIDAMYERLCSVDPENTVDRHNPKRVIRALEVYELTGKTLGEWNAESKLEPPKHQSLIIGLRYNDRERLYERINKRVDIMLEMGLLDEVKQLISMGIKDTVTAGQAIGYKEYYPYFDGTMTLEECTEKLKQESRKYAKRQMTWFKRNPKIKWIDLDDITAEEIIATASGYVDEFLGE
ncbi:MAG: tRNA (adenosine(37)-N6)-dimethylallyltransferase MiaA [Clostridia bacterium]|nr:tRNA (adenosine(37)-N6)-dimethylallyltransferase MiaA [Clostridia bacterium]